MREPTDRETIISLREQLEAKGKIIERAVAFITKELPDYPWHNVKAEDLNVAVNALVDARRGCAQATEDMHVREQRIKCDIVDPLEQLVQRAYIDGFKTGVHVRQEAKAQEYYRCSIALRELGEIIREITATWPVEKGERDGTAQ